MPHATRKKAFSFAEVMFAVIILGVGFIMIAALFPVAISQSKSTADETSSAAFARAAANYVAQMGTNTNMHVSIGTDTAPISNTVQVLALPTNGSTALIGSTGLLIQAISGNIISSDDPRYAWVPFYFRGDDPNTTPSFTTNLPYAQLILICVQATNTPTFTDADIHPSSGVQNLRGRPVQVVIANSPPGTPDYIGFGPTTSKEAPLWGDARGAVAEGCFVIIRADTTNVVSGKPKAGGRCTGRIYRVGVRRPDLDGQTVPSYFYNGTTLVTNQTISLAGLQVWELAPGNDFTPEPQVILPAGAPPPGFIPAANPPGNSISGSSISGPAPVEAYVVGRSLANLTDPTKGFEGPAMDVAAYSTFIYCKQ